MTIPMPTITSANTTPIPMVSGVNTLSFFGSTGGMYSRVVLIVSSVGELCAK